MTPEDVNFNKAEFVISAVDTGGFKQDGLPHFVFAGRSNVGKSSAINKLLGRAALARTSATPGKTAQVNFYRVDNKIYFVDLPGYGYASVSKAEQARWGRMMDKYFEVCAERIRLGLMIVDIRRKPTALDVIMADYFRRRGIAFIVVANKLDKIGKTQRVGAMNTVVSTLSIDEVDVFPFSAVTGEGGREILGRVTSVIMQIHY